MTHRTIQGGELEGATWNECRVGRSALEKGLYNTALNIHNYILQLFMGEPQRSTEACVRESVLADMSKHLPS